MLTGIHFLLTYSCTFECDHCFLYCSPEARGTFTLKQIQDVLDEAEKIGTVESTYIEGGEPFLFYPLMIESVKMARERGLKVGIVTNAYWATSEEDAEYWLKPFCELGLDDLSISDDSFHQGDDEAQNTARMAIAAAKKLGLPVGDICIEEPSVVIEESETTGKGEPVVGGNVKMRGRAADKLSDGLPGKPASSYDCCPYEELEHPGRVHVDSYGNVQMCQGISMGNMWKTPLSELVASYDAKQHPICGPLVEGGPQALAKKYGIAHDKEYVDACHLCYLVRKELIDLYPEYVAPRQVYGLK